MTGETGVAKAREISQKVGVGAGIGAQMAPEKRKDAWIISADGKESDGCPAVKRQNA